MKKYSILNSRAPRIDAPDKATGRAKFIDDLYMPGMLYGALLQSPIAHAKILSIDTSQAEKLPGVKAVVTHKDAGLDRYGVSPARYDEAIFCHDKVHYIGDEIAAVAAVDLETALEAVSLIKVEYEPLPLILTVEEAMAPGACLVHEEAPGNISAEVHHEFGDFDAALATCDVVRTDTFQSKRQDAAFIEPQGCLADYDLRGYMNLYSATQTTHYLQRIIAMTLKLPIGKVRVAKPYVGGGFGPKAGANTMEIVACMLSIKTGKPVKMNYTREQVFLFSRARHSFTHTLTTGVKKDGTIVALANECKMDGGAYTGYGIATIYYAGSLLGAPYKLKSMKYDAWRYYTNKPASGAQRGHGGVIARAAWEQQLDTLAEEIGMDPVELRLKNMMVAGDVTINDLNMSSLGMKECIETVRDASDWQKLKGKLPKGKGIGMACGFFVTGAGYPIYRSDTYHCTVTIKLNEDGGSVNVYTGSCEIGQGSDHTMAAITAEVLGIPIDMVRIFSGDTDYSLDLGAYSSRQTLMTGQATKMAAEDVKRQVLETLSNAVKVGLDELSIKDGYIVFDNPGVNFASVRKSYRDEHRSWKDNPEGDRLTFKEAARIAFLERGTVIGKGKYKPAVLGGKYKGAAVGTSMTYGASAQVAQVSVDMETGQITVENMTDAHDCGFALNKTQVEGQIQGSLQMGMGEALMEEVKFDDKGKILNANLGEYKMPTALDMPNINACIVESHEPYGPFGAKEVGEGAIMPTIPAILNAVYDATGVRIHELPLTPERVLMAIKAKKDKKKD